MLEGGKMYFEDGVVIRNRFECDIRVLKLVGEMRRIINVLVLLFICDIVY